MSTSHSHADAFAPAFPVWKRVYLPRRRATLLRAPLFGRFREDERGLVAPQSQFFLPLWRNSCGREGAGRQEERELKKEREPVWPSSVFRPILKSFSPRMCIIPRPAAAAVLAFPRLSWWEWEQI